MAMTDIVGFRGTWPKRALPEWSATGFASWFRRASTREQSSPTTAAASEDPTSAQAAFGAWGMAVWRSLKLRGVRDRDVEDVLQDVFVIVFTNWDKFRGESSRKTWVYGVAHGVVANYHRKNKRAAAEPALVGDEPWLNMPTSPADDPMSQSVARQELEWLSSVLSALRQEDRALFVLRHLDGCTVKEAARIVGMSLQLAQTRLLTAEKVVESALQRHQARDTWRIR